MLNTHTPIEIFYVFGPEDVKLVEKLEKHLILLQRQRLIAAWHPHPIQTEADWQQITDTHHPNASVIILLINPDQLTSNHNYGMEMQSSLEREQAHGVRIIPILLQPANWQNTPFVQSSATTLLTTRNTIDRAFVEIAAGIRRTLEDLSLLTLQGKENKSSIIWNVPFTRNPFFQGREDILTQIHTRLQKKSKHRHPQRQIINGAEGIGKTQIAIEYAYRFRHEYEAVLWVCAENKDTLNASYADLASVLLLPEKQEKKQEIAVQGVRHWLQTHQNWLLILDNADNPDKSIPFLPQKNGGHILITTRKTAVRNIRPLSVETLPPESGALLLLQRAGLLLPNAPLQDATTQNQTIALEIAQESGGLPLVLDQVGAYLETTGTDLATYQKIYQQQYTKLLQERPAQEHNPEPVAATTLISIKQIESHNPIATELLHLCAFLAPDAISETLLTQSEHISGLIPDPLMTDRYLQENACETLRTYALITRDPYKKNLSMHRLTQHAVRVSLPLATQDKWKKRIIELMAQIFPSTIDATTWPTCEQLLPHVLLCSYWIEDIQCITPAAAHLLNNAGYYLNQRGRYKEAMPLLQQALAIYEHIASDHPDTAQALSNLAFLLHHQRRYKKATRLLLQALDIQEKTIGKNHPQTASSINALASLYRDQGKHNDAQLHYQQALDIRERVLGPEHLDTAQSLHNLAWYYYNLGDYNDAEPLYSRALAIHKQIQGTNHPDTASIMNDLASLYQKQGKDNEAQLLYEQALLIREDILGPRHPDTVQSMINLAKHYYIQRNYKEAEALFQQALTIREQTLGLKHADTIESLNNLASFYLEQGKYAEATPLFHQALAIRERVYGPDHLYTTQSLNNLASLYLAQGKYTEATPLFHQALAIRERILGPDHPDTQTIRNRLITLLQFMSQGQQKVSAEIETG